jgi:hypothetical protein
LDSTGCIPELDVHGEQVHEELDVHGEQVHEELDEIDCKFCANVVILGDVDVSLVQHLIVQSEIFVENAFYFYDTSYCASWNICGKGIYFFIIEIQTSDRQDNEPVTTKPHCPQPSIATSDRHLFLPVISMHTSVTGTCRSLVFLIPVTSH